MGLGFGFGFGFAVGLRVGVGVGVGVGVSVAVGVGVAAAVSVGSGDGRSARKASAMSEADCWLRDRGSAWTPGKTAIALPASNTTVAIATRPALRGVSFKNPPPGPRAPSRDR